MSINKELLNLNNLSIVWRKHALQRMMERDILRSEVKESITKGEIIEHYPNDNPCPSISTQEAKQRVADAVERYKNGTGTYSPYDESFVGEMDEYIQSQTYCTLKKI